MALKGSEEKLCTFKMYITLAGICSVAYPGSNALKRCSEVFAKVFFVFNQYQSVCEAMVEDGGL